MRSAFFIVVSLAFAPSCRPATVLHVAAPTPDQKQAVLEAFLSAYHAADCDRLRAFIRDRYHSKITSKEELVGQFTRSFMQLHQEFGPLEERDRSLDTNYKAVKHHLYSPALKEWATLVFVEDPGTGKVLGHGLWKLEGPPGWSPGIPAEPIADRLRRHLGDLQAAGMFHGAVLLADGNGALLDTTIGALGSGVPRRTLDRYPIASITKMFTAAAILALESEGKLRLEDRIAKYIIEYPPDISGLVTIRHLLQHTSGIELDDHGPYNEACERARSVDELIAVHVQFIDSMNGGRRQGFKPLEAFDYTNEGYHLLGAIVERVTGQPFARALDQLVMTPAGLKSTSFEGEPRLRSITHRLHGQPDPCATTEVTFGTAPLASPSGGLFSTTHDLHRFFQWLRERRLLDRMMADAVMEDGVRVYGSGIDLVEAPPRAIGHNGGIAGASAELRWFPDHDVLFIALCDRERSAPDLFYYLRKQMGP